jgi:hypothetical protein
VHRFKKNSYPGKEHLTKNKLDSVCGNLKLQHLSKKNIMKKILCGLFVFGLVTACNAQTADKKTEVKFTPPVITKNKATAKSASKAKIAPPVVVSDEEVKFTPPVIKKNQPSKKKEKVKFTPPVITKDKSTK